VSHISILGLLLLSHILPLCAQEQVLFVSSSQRRISVASYLGTETADNFSDFRFRVVGPESGYADWSLSVRLAEPVVAVSGGPNRSGKPFPADKIAFRWTAEDSRTSTRVRSTQSGRKYIALQEAGEAMLVVRAETPIAPNGQAYADIRQFGSIRIAAGAYLDDYLSADPHTPITYLLPLVFTLYDGQMQVIGSHQTDCELVLEDGLADAMAAGVAPDYALTVDPAAQNTVLLFQTASDYADGVSVTVRDAVKVNARTDFEVSVRFLDEAFKGAADRTLPLSVLSVRLIGGSFGGGPASTASTAEKTALLGRSSDKKKAQYFHIRYDAKFTPAQLASLRPGTYVVSLLYQLLPK